MCVSMQRKTQWQRLANSCCDCGELSSSKNTPLPGIGGRWQVTTLGELQQWEGSHYSGQNPQPGNRSWNRTGQIDLSIQWRSFEYGCCSKVMKIAGNAPWVWLTNSGQESFLREILHVLLKTTLRLHNFFQIFFGAPQSVLGRINKHR